MGKVTQLLELEFEPEHTKFFGEMVVETEMETGQTRHTFKEEVNGTERTIDDGKVNCSMSNNPAGYRNCEGVDREGKSDRNAMVCLEGDTY